jgi:hypothetical protein
MQLLPAAGMASGSHIIMYSRAHRISGSFLVDGSLCSTLFPGALVKITYMDGRGNIKDHVICCYCKEK